MRPSSVLAVGILFGLLGLAGCASHEINESDPATMYKDAEEDIKSDHYQVAIDKLRAVKNRFPYSNYAIEAQLRIADVYYMQESFGEAAASYETFRDLHPKHPKAPYAMFRIAKSYYQDAPGNVARDMTSARKAVDAYEAFLKRFPTAPEADEARKDLTSVRKLLAEKELYIGNFYYKRGDYAAAKPRYQKIIETYSETDSAKTAKEKLDRIAKKETHE